MLWVVLQIMFESVKNKIFGKKEEKLAEIDVKEGFPKSSEGREIGHGEFRKILEEQKPKEVFARGWNATDYTIAGDFYIRLHDSTVVRTYDFYPPIGGNNDVAINQLPPVGVLDNLPYHRIVYLSDETASFHDMNFLCKFVLKDSPK